MNLNLWWHFNTLLYFQPLQFEFAVLNTITHAKHYLIFPHEEPIMWITSFALLVHVQVSTRDPTKCQVSSCIRAWCRSLCFPKEPNNLRLITPLIDVNRRSLKNILQYAPTYLPYARLTTANHYCALLLCVACTSHCQLWLVGPSHWCSRTLMTLPINGPRRATTRSRSRYTVCWAASKSFLGTTL